MINGMHALIYAKDADKARAFFRDVLGFDHVDAGQGWLIFAMPPAEIGIHPVMEGDKGFHELYFMCDDIKKTVAQLEKKGVQCAPIQHAGFGIMTSIEIPGGGPLGIYQPLHPVAIAKPRKGARKETSMKVVKKTSAKKPVRKVVKKRVVKRVVRKRVAKRAARN